MKKMLFTIAVLAAFAVASSDVMAQAAKKGVAPKKGSASAYTDPYANGNVNVNLGIGLGMVGIYGDTVIPPISLSAEYSTTSFNNLPLSFGGIIGYSSSEYKTAFFGDEYGWEYTYIVFGARGSFHFNQYIKVPNLDVYAGLLLGYNYVSAKEIGTVTTGVAASASYPMFGGYAGARYFFTEKIGAFCEIGYGIGYINVGLTAKL